MKDQVKTKICLKCKTRRLIKFFYISNSNGYLHISSYCKNCEIKLRSRYKKKNIEKTIKSQIRYWTRKLKQLHV